MSHTPGPWWAGTDEDAHMVYAGDCEAVADTLREDGDSITEAANALLIAAAPDLLHALKELCRWCCRPGDDSKHDDGYDNARKLAREAVARAEGRTT